MKGLANTRKNKAQISGQVFIYVLAAVMIALIMFIGVKAIGTIMSAGAKSNLDSLKSDFKSVAETNAREYGSVKKYEFNIPSKYDEICFVDAMEDDGKFHVDTSKITNPLIKSSVTVGDPENVFLNTRGVWQEKFTVDNLDVQADYLCLENTGKIAVWLKGTGKRSLLYTQS